MNTLKKISLTILIMFISFVQIMAQGKNNINKKTFYLSLGSGVALTSLFPYSGYNPGINLQFNAMKIMSDGYAIRGDLQYSHNVPIDHFPTKKGGHLNTYSMKFNFLLGNFRETSTVSGYAIAGAGLNILKHSDIEYSYPEYDYNSMTYTGRQITYTYEDEADSFINLDCGGGLRFKISDKCSIYSEAQYTFPVIVIGRYGGPTLYGIFFGAPSLKVGAQIAL